MIIWHSFCTIDFQILKILEKILLTHTTIFYIIFSIKNKTTKKENKKMKNINEIRSEIEYLIDTYFTNSNLNYNEFLDWFEPENYFQDICDDQSYDSYDLDKFQNDAYESYNDFFYDFYTDKYLNKSDSELLEMFGSMDDDQEIEIEDIVEQYDYEMWWSEVQDSFNFKDYKID